MISGVQAAVVGWLVRERRRQHQGQNTARPTLRTSQSWHFTRQSNCAGTCWAPAVALRSDRLFQLSPNDRRVSRGSWIFCLFVLFLLTFANLRGLRESGFAFMPPTYLFVGCLALVLVIGIARPALLEGIRTR